MKLFVPDISETEVIEIMQAQNKRKNDSSGMQSRGIDSLELDGS
jgi:hypothetical protein